ncbi:MAG: AAA family ATPase, partial [Acidobacteria bacterium]|nr:AAA family ATPase [Acidobacteriota bacterium]
MDSDRSPVPPLLRTLLSRELLVVTGKGGVGKSVVSAALAAVIAASGRRVLLMEVDPRENLHQLFDLPPSGGEIVRAAERLYLQNLRPQRVLDELTREQIKIAFLARRVIESPVYRHFTEGARGWKNSPCSATRCAKCARTEPAMPDTVILDAPATGHGVSLLAAPAL